MAARVAQVIGPGAALAMALAVPAGRADEASPTVELACGRTQPLTDEGAARLAERAESLLESSQSNSQLPEWHFPVAEVLAEYRAALANQHLRVRFASARTIHSVGGPLQVREIVVRIGAEAEHDRYPDRFVDTLFSLDDSGEVAGQALYSGQKVIELWRVVRDSAQGGAGCRLPPVTGWFTP